VASKALEVLMTSATDSGLGVMMAAPPWERLSTLTPSMRKVLEVRR